MKMKNEEKFHKFICLFVLYTALIVMIHSVFLKVNGYISLSLAGQTHSLLIVIVGLLYYIAMIKE